MDARENCQCGKEIENVNVGRKTVGELPRGAKTFQNSNNVQWRNNILDEEGKLKLCL